MKLFDVYPVNDITITKAEGSTVWDDKGQQYLDLYGGHAVISIGHTHPHYVQRLTDQLGKVGFYSNSIHIPLQAQLAEKLGKISGKECAAFWYNPKNGEYREAGKHSGKAQQEFVPPSSGYGHDWVLIIDDATKNYPLPGK